MTDVWSLAAPLPAIILEPLRVAPSTHAERFDLNYEREQATARSFPAERNYRLQFDRAAEAFRQQGVELDNPFTDMASPYTGFSLNPLLMGRQRRQMQAERDRRLKAWDDAAARLQAENPDALDTYPNSAGVRLSADQRARQAARAADAAEDTGGGLGGFAGTIVGTMQDPVQGLALLLGAPWRAVTGAAGLLREIGRAAAAEAAIGAITQAGIERSAAPFRERLGVEGDALGSILGAAIGGAVLGGGLRGAVGLFELRGVRARAEAPNATPTDLRASDALALAGARLDELAGNPAGAGRVREHEAALDRATADTAAGLDTASRVEPERPNVPNAARGFVERMLADGEGGTATAGQPQRFNVFTPAGRAVLVEPQVVELRQLVPSHLDDGSQNPAYPHAEGVQPRDRGAAPSRDQVRAIAAGLIPERLAPNREAGFGAPIVADDLVVESGNGRVGALRVVYGDPALAEVRDAYRAFLLAQGYDLTGIANPVLVSRRISGLSPAERRSFVAEANGRATLAQGVAERARADADKLDDALPLWRGGDVDSADNAGFVRAFLLRLTPEERGSLITKDGRLAAEGAARVRAAVLARAYGDELGPLLDRLLEGDTAGLRGVAGALTDTSARWAQLRQAVMSGEVDAGMDITADLIGALRTLDEARRLKISVPELLLQTDLERPPLTDAGIKMLAAFFDQGDPGRRTAARAAIAARIDGYVEEALKVQPPGRDLFGAPPLRPAEILEGARLREAPPGEARAGETRAAEPRDAQPLSITEELPAPAGAFDFGQEAVDILAARQRAIREGVEAEAAARPPVRQMASAELLEAQRIAAERDVPVPDGEVSADGAPQATRGARDLLDEAEAEAEQAGQAMLCLIGGAA